MGINDSFHFLSRDAWNRWIGQGLHMHSWCRGLVLHGSLWLARGAFLRSLFSMCTLSILYIRSILSSLYNRSVYRQPSSLYRFLCDLNRRDVYLLLSMSIFQGVYCLLHGRESRR